MTVSKAGTLIDSNPADINGASTSQFRLSQSMENIQEFHVEAKTYAAEYGRGTGGQVMVITKSVPTSLMATCLSFSGTAIWTPETISMLLRLRRPLSA